MPAPPAFCAGGRAGDPAPVPPAAPLPGLSREMTGEGVATGGGNAEPAETTTAPPLLAGVAGLGGTWGWGTGGGIAPEAPEGLGKALALRSQSTNAGAFTGASAMLTRRQRFTYSMRLAITHALWALVLHSAQARMGTDVVCRMALSCWPDPTLKNTTISGLKTLTSSCVKDSCSSCGKGMTSSCGHQKSQGEEEEAIAISDPAERKRRSRRRARRRRTRRKEDEEEDEKEEEE